ncbi:MAG TPA: lysophospholipid acyltransferase family protein [Cyclobacteriaceae bacterium]|nr:lysophospholipid acyltransferase family protein [Cyclobacteriaceae bacterium]HMV07859.1 lysophospholipid acyltransferase family protein [Cyclobacteriaceae bacterium]HMV88127.1 lysophospholipid acyltransferase family protein [Cyclobacteriaceae bacterium]HMW98993.1 lysophospholipid acyltransferase family protein [Cyclobacteriaceae bacterium]HMX48373.1 lysophospholipid acyltransferase family protein [Cyclobacteriaceae bacterium]
MFFLRLISYLPLGILYLFSDFLFIVAYYIIPYRKKLVRKNLVNSFPEKSIAEIKKIERQFYRNLCDYAVETLKLLTISKEELNKRVSFTNPELIEPYRLRNQPIIGLASHQFNWEWLLVAGNFHFTLDYVYQPINTKLTDKLLIAIRSRFGGHAIKRNELGREMVKRRNLWRMIAIVSDQYPGQKKDKKYITRFLNQETAFFQAPDQIASLTQYPVVFSAIRKVKRGYYETTFVPLTEPPYIKDQENVIERYVQEAEKIINENPAGWLWSHKRWKKRHLKQASAKYPPASAVS